MVGAGAYVYRLVFDTWSSQNGADKTIGAVWTSWISPTDQYLQVRRKKTEHNGSKIYNRKTLLPVMNILNCM